MITSLNYQLKKRIESSECSICHKSIDKNELLIELSFPSGDDDAIYEFDYCLNCGRDMIKEDIKNIKKVSGKLYKILNKTNMGL